MRLNIALCDDERSQNGWTAAAVAEWAALHGHLVTVTPFETAEAFWFAYGEDQSFDILLLDIELRRPDGPEAMNGVELARKLRGAGAALQIIFVSGYEQYLADGYDVSALHFLVKPVKKEKLFEVLGRAAQRLAGREKSLVVTAGRAAVRIPLDKIMYAEAELNYVGLHTTDGVYRTKMTLTELEARLDDGFFRTGRSFVVGLRYVKSISKTAVTLDDGCEIPLGRGLYAAANQAFIRFY